MLNVKNIMKIFILKCRKTVHYDIHKHRIPLTILCKRERFIRHLIQISQLPVLRNKIDLDCIRAKAVVSAISPCLDRYKYGNRISQN